MADDWVTAQERIESAVKEAYAFTRRLGHPDHMLQAWVPVDRRWRLACGVCGAVGYIAPRQFDRARVSGELFTFACRAGANEFLGPIGWGGWKR